MVNKEHSSIQTDEEPWTERLHRLAAGDLAALDALYRQFAATVYQIAFHIVQDAAEAEDVCHDVFLELLQHPDRYDPERGSLQAWLAVKTKSRAIDRLRKKQRQRAATQWRNRPPPETRPSKPLSENWKRSCCAKR